MVTTFCYFPLVKSVLFLFAENTKWLYDDACAVSGLAVYANRKRLGIQVGKL